MKYCHQCGREANDQAAFCAGCGTKLISEPAAETVAVSEPVTAAESAPAFEPAPAPAPVAAPTPATTSVRVPIRQLSTNRGLAKFILLSMLTFGIYGLVVMTSVSNDINTVAEHNDGKRTMNYCLLAFVFSALTLGIAPIVWSHRISNRIGNQLSVRGIAYSFSASDFWLWGVLGSFIFVGPFIYMHKFLKSMNLICEHYNEHGELAAYVPVERPVGEKPKSKVNPFLAALLIAVITYAVNFVIGLAINAPLSQLQHMLYMNGSSMLATVLMLVIGMIRTTIVLVLVYLLVYKLIFKAKLSIGGLILTVVLCVVLSILFSLPIGMVMPMLVEGFMNSGTMHLYSILYSVLNGIASLTAYFLGSIIPAAIFK